MSDLFRFVVRLSVFGVLIALAGCASGDRLVRNSPMGEEWTNNLESESVYLWPLAYSDGNKLSILWPMMDFDDNGFAVRPFFHRNGENYGILWPLCGFDRESGWAGPYLWGKDYRGVPILCFKSKDFFNAGPVVVEDKSVAVLPVFRWSDRFNYAGPVWWNRSSGSFGFFPIAWKFTDGWCVANTWWNGTARSGGIFPLAYWSPEANYAGNVFWNRKSGAYGVVPLFWNSDTFKLIGNTWWRPGKATGGVFPLAMWDPSFGLAGNVWWRPGQGRGGVFPLARWSPGFSYAGNAWWNKEKGTGGFFPLAGFHEETGYVLNYIQGKDYWLILPLAGKGSDWFFALNYIRSGNWEMAPPLFLIRRAGEDRDFLMPLVSFGKSGDRLNYFNVAGMLYDYRREGKIHSVLFPGFLGGPRLGETTFFSPLVSFGRDQEGMTALNVAGLLADYQRGEGWSIPPLMTWSSYENGEHSFISPFYSRKIAADGSLAFRNVGGIFYHDNGKGKQVFPLFFSGMREDAEGKAFYSPFVSRGRKADGSLDFLNIGGFLYHDNGEGAITIPPLLSSFRNDAKGKAFYSPFASCGSKADGSLDFLNIGGVLYHDNGKGAITIPPLLSGFRSDKKGKRFYSPFFSHGSKADGALDFLNIGGFLYHDNGEGAITIPPFLSGFRSDEYGKRFFSPFFSRGRKADGSLDFLNIGGFLYHDNGEGAITIPPLLSGFRSDELGKRFYSPFFSYGRKADGSLDFLNIGGILYRDNGKGAITIPPLLSGFRSDAEGKRFYSPFFSYGRKADGSFDFLNIGGLLYHNNGEGYQQFMLPFAGVERTGDIRGAYLFPLFRYTRTGGARAFFMLDIFGNDKSEEEGVGVMIPFLGFSVEERRTAERPVKLPKGDDMLVEDKSFQPNSVKREYNSFVFPLLSGSMNGVANVWNGRFSRKELDTLHAALKRYEDSLIMRPASAKPKPAKERSEALLAEVNNALRAMKIDLPLSPGTEALEEWKRRILERECIERDYGRTIVLAGLPWASSYVGNEFSRKIMYGLMMKHLRFEKQEEFSILGYLYRYQRSHDRERRWIFPAITAENSAQGSKWSFCWRLLESHDVDGRRGGHIFFIPWGEPAAETSN